MKQDIPDKSYKHCQVYSARGGRSVEGNNRALLRIQMNLISEKIRIVNHYETLISRHFLLSPRNGGKDDGG
jgi:hypothetical protein